MRGKINRFKYSPIWVLMFVSLSSCMVGPDYVRPPAETAAQ